MRTAGELHDAAWRAGIQPHYIDAWGQQREVGEDTLRAALEVLEGEHHAGALIVRPGKELPIDGDAWIELEDGDAVDPSHVPELPIGRHRLVTGSDSRPILVAPERMYWPGDMPAWGVFLPLYALASARGTDLGDLTDLDRLATALAPHGAGSVSVLPLLATEPEGPSPYAPLSRRFWNELHLDLSLLPGGAAALEEPGLRERIDRRRYERFVDWPAVARDVHQVLDAVDVEPPGEDALLEGYVRFRSGGDPAAARRHRIGQWAMEAQLARLAESLASRDQMLALDLPVGARGDGFDVGEHRRQFVEGWSVGAPPDTFFSAGQDWGFPPPHPVHTRDDGHRLFGDSVATLARHAAIIRIDHVMALERLWWIPPGARADEGVYVGYPMSELVAAIAIESHRHRAIVVGEDLGTVSPAVRRAMREAHVLGMFEEQFAIDDAHESPPDVPADVVAGLNTHDMPTFAGFYAGSDIADRLDLGLVDHHDATHLQARRRDVLARYRAGLGGVDDDPAAVMRAALARLGRSDARHVVVALEDLWLEPRPQNVPGTVHERPNWTRRHSVAAEAIPTDERVASGLTVLDDARRGRR